MKTKIEQIDGLETALGSLALNKSEFKTGTNSFTTGLTHVVTDTFITALTFVNVIPTGTKAGEWSVVASVGSFTITSDTAETNCAFNWNALKAGV